ncbi:MAG: peptidase U32 family protein [Desulfosalsimonadaceae bacterium]
MEKSDFMDHKKIELLAPAGNFEKLEAAIHFGADAVYLGGKEFSLRRHSGNFTTEEIADAVACAHRRGVNVYVACNVFARNDERAAIYRHLEQIVKTGADAVIVADPGIFMAAKEVMGDSADIHVSTQANTTSVLSARFWANHGAKRINAARELALSEIREIASSVPVEVEAFVHGAMCVAVSGRCLLSHYLAGRDGNRGLCAHACRWKYFLVEETRPGEYMPVYEDNRGAYFFSARDLCMIDHVPEMIEAGIASLKIEGRMKGLNYIAAAVKTYRHAIDAYYEDPSRYRVDEAWRSELDAINYRGYSTGFYRNDTEGTIPVYDTGKRNHDHRYIGKILQTNGDCEIVVDIKNRILKEGPVEVVGREGPARKNKVLRITTDADFDAAAAQPNDKATLVLERPDACKPGDIIRAL